MLKSVESCLQHRATSCILDMDVELACCAVSIFQSVYIRKRRRRTKRRIIWTRDWLLRREELGAFNCLISELRAGDAPSYRNFMRLDAETFEDLHSKLSHLIEKQNTRFRKAVPTRERLAVTLRFLATGKN